MSENARPLTLETPGRAPEYPRGGTDVQRDVRYEAMPGPYGMIMVPRLSDYWSGTPENRWTRTVAKQRGASDGNPARGLRTILTRLTGRQPGTKLATRAS